LIASCCCCDGSGGGSGGAAAAVIDDMFSMSSSRLLNMIPNLDKLITFKYKNEKHQDKVKSKRDTKQSHEHGT